MPYGTGRGRQIPEIDLTELNSACPKGKFPVEGVGEEAFSGPYLLLDPP